MSSTINGIYAAYLSGKIGAGFALLWFKDGQIGGADASGVIFDGGYTKNGNNDYQVDLQVKTPANIRLLQGGLSGPEGISYNLNFELPTNFYLSDFVRIETPPGPINAKFLKIRSIND